MASGKIITEKPFISPYTKLVNRQICGIIASNPVNGGSYIGIVCGLPEEYSSVQLVELRMPYIGDVTNDFTLNADANIGRIMLVTHNASYAGKAFYGFITITL